MHKSAKKGVFWQEYASFPHIPQTFPQVCTQVEKKDVENFFERKNNPKAVGVILLTEYHASVIRLRRVLLLRSDIRLTTSDIRYASFMANKISLKP